MYFYNFKRINIHEILLFVSDEYNWIILNCNDNFHETIELSTHQTNTHLNKEKQINNNTKQHECFYCKKSFSTKRKRDNHIEGGCKSNTTSKNLKCNICDYETIYKANIRRHNRNIHKIGGPRNSYICELCGFITKYRHCLGRHIKSCKEK